VTPPPDDAAPTVSVVIPTRSRRESLELLREALRHERCHEIIVVDDGSDDDTAVWLAAQAESLPLLRALSTPGVGPNPARAVGAENATGTVVLFVDDDVLPARGVVAAHARHHRRAGGTVVSGYYPVLSGPRMPATSRFLAHSYEQDIQAVKADPSLGLLRLWGGLVSIRRDDLRRVPMAIPAFDGHWRHGDLEFGIRCHKAGLRHVFDPELLGHHRFARTLAQFREDARRSGYGATRVSLLHPDIRVVDSAVPGSRPGVTDALLRLSDRLLWYRAATATLGLLVRTGDAVGLARIADNAVVALSLVEKRRGARASLRDVRSSDPAARDVTPTANSIAT
jgi:glycosyltransferase involved in cell wall biosynthesis